MTYSCRDGGEKADEFARRMMGKTIPEVMGEDKDIIAVEVKVVRRKKR